MAGPSQPDPLREVAKMIADLREDMDAKLDRHRDELRAEMREEAQGVRADIVDGLAYLYGDPEDERKALGTPAVAAPARPPAKKCHRRGRFWVIPAAGAIAWVWRHRAGTLVGSLAAASTGVAVWLPTPTPAMQQPLQRPSVQATAPARPDVTPADTPAAAVSHTAQKQHHRTRHATIRPRVKQPSSTTAPSGTTTSRDRRRHAPLLPSRASTPRHSVCVTLLPGTVVDDVLRKLCRGK